MRDVNRHVNAEFRHFIKTQLCNGMGQYEYNLRALTQKPNQRILSAVELSASMFERKQESPRCTKTMNSEAREIITSMPKLRDSFVYRNQEL